MVIGIRANDFGKYLAVCLSFVEKKATLIGRKSQRGYNSHNLVISHNKSTKIDSTFEDGQVQFKINLYSLLS